MSLCVSFFFFFNDTATTEIYTLSLHDALPICRSTNGCLRLTSFITSITRFVPAFGIQSATVRPCTTSLPMRRTASWSRSEEHTSELQSRQYLVCRLLLEKKKNSRNASC